MRTRFGKNGEKSIHYPELSPQLAELAGIILGDGGISQYQLTITLNRFSDLEYSKYVELLVKMVFDVQPSIYERGSVVQIVVSRVRLIRFLLKLNFSIGNKVRQQVNVPEWITESLELTKACIRGLLDTDGCFYVDRHQHNDKLYLNPGLSFTNQSKPILYFFKKSLEDLGFHPTQKTECCVFLRREEEIGRYFKEIGSSNPKHSEKYKSYLVKKYGEVAEWSNAIASKAIIP